MRNKVMQFALSGKLLNTFYTQTQAAKETQCSYARITKMCRGEERTVDGFYWSTNDKLLESSHEERVKIFMSIPKGKSKGNSVQQLDKDTGDVVNTFTNQSLAAQSVGSTQSTISQAIKKGVKSYEYYWR